MIKQWTDLKPHPSEHNVVASRDELDGARLIECATCDETLATEKHHGEAFEALWLYYTATPSPAEHWPAVKMAFPAELDTDEEPYVEVGSGDGGYDEAQQQEIESESDKPADG